MIDINLYFHCIIFWITYDFFIYLMHFTSELQMAITVLFVNETSSVGMHFLSLNVTTILVPKCFWFAKIVRFCIFSTSFFQWVRHCM